MKSRTALAGTALLAGLALLSGRPAPAVDDKGTVVELGNLKSRAPADWKFGETANKFRLYQAKLPKADGDKEDAELIIFYFGPGGGGGTKENIQRWKGQFAAPEGKKIDDVSKVTEMKVGGAPATFLDITSGTYRFKERPFDPNAPVTEKKDYRLFGVILEADKGPYFIRVTGPAKTMAKHKGEFDNWLKNFK